MTDHPTRTTGSRSRSPGSGLAAVRGEPGSGLSDPSLLPGSGLSDRSLLPTSGLSPSPLAGEGRGGGLGRRAVLALLAVAAARPAAAAEGRAAIPDLAISCDATLQPALRRVAALFSARTRAPVHLFSAPPTLMLAQIERQTQTDLLITVAGALDEAAQRRLIKPETRIGSWRNRLVIAARQGDAPGTDVLQRLGDGSFAVTDPTIEETFDGPAVLARLGLAEPLGSRLIGVANTAEVVFLLKRGTARLGLVQRTDVRADPALAVAAAVPDGAYAPIVYGAAAAATAASPNAQAFLDFLGSEQARNQLRSDGLEIVT